jgi:hypothetical protein
MGDGKHQTMKISNTSNSAVQQGEMSPIGAHIGALCLAASACQP